MPKRNDGNETDLRARAAKDAPSLDGDNPFTGAHPPDKLPCDNHGTQTDLITGTTPDGEIVYNWADLTEICENGLSSLAMDRLFMGILKNHFSNPDNIFRDILKSYIYDPDASKTKIRIVMNTEFDTESVGQLPTIVVKRGNQKSNRAMMGDRADMRRSTEGVIDYVRFTQGSHRILVMAELDGQAEALGNEVWDLFTFLSPVLYSEYPLHDFQVVTFSEIGNLDDIGSSLAIAITCNYAYEYAWTISRIAPKLQATNVEVTTSLTTAE